MLCKVIDIRAVHFDEESLIRSEKKLVMTILRHFGDVLVEGDTGALLMREWRTTASKIFGSNEQVLQKLLGRIRGITNVVAPCVTVLSSIVEFLNEAADNVRGDLNYEKILNVLENEPILIKRPEFHMLSPKDGHRLLPHQLLLLRFDELFGGLYSNSFLAGIGQLQLYKLNIDRILKNNEFADGSERLTSDHEKRLRSQSLQCMYYENLLSDLNDKKNEIEQELNSTTERLLKNDMSA